MHRQHVAVIGAGAAGLCAAHRLQEQCDRFTFDVFEQTDLVGGTWVYTENTGLDDNGLPIHSSMYTNLRTNIPKEIMSFPDFSFAENAKSFVHHSDVLKYLTSYARHYDLYKHIQFHTLVKRVTPVIIKDQQIKWHVVIEDIKQKQEKEHVYDAVMVCNGHYAVPNSPDVPGISDFAGVVIHSHEYRNPESFQGMGVVLLGASASGVDIAMELASTSRQTYLSHNQAKPIKSGLPDNVTQVAGIRSATNAGFVLQDGTTCKADALVFCTGYKYEFPFLQAECQVTVDDNRVCGLYKHLIHMHRPTLCFVGLPTSVLPFPMFDFQIRYFLQTLSKSVKLPSKEDMEKETEMDFEKRLSLNMPPRYAHKMTFTFQWEYFDDLATSGEFEKLEPISKQVYDNVALRRQTALMDYKNDVYTILENGNFLNINVTLV